jgi:hypothetical protein
VASPTIRTSIVTEITTATTAPVINIQAAAGTIKGGDTILVVFRSAAAGAVGFPAGWSELVDAAPDDSGDQVAIAWKKADAGDGTTITLSSGNGKCAACSWTIAGATDPTIRAPEISTVQVGVTTEPNATTVTPTGGSKDYLFLTLFTMEGEQTGVTAYPSGYTDGQLYADTGTGGATTTNVSVGGAARGATAASEDTGVWDVTGTLDASSNYTIAFHPAEPSPYTYEMVAVMAQPRRAQYFVAANLLLTTLAVVPGAGNRRRRMIICGSR